MARSSHRVFVVLRVDHNLLALEPDLAFKAVAVFDEEARAVEDAGRLDLLNDDKGAKYFVQAAPWVAGEPPSTP